MFAAYALIKAYIQQFHMHSLYILWTPSLLLAWQQSYPKCIHGVIPPLCLTQYLHPCNLWDLYWGNEPYAPLYLRDLYWGDDEPADHKRSQTN
jgi:hypothetical protein